MDIEKELKSLSEEEYRLVTELRHKQLAELAGASRQAQFDYGKWLIGTLVVIHGGAFLGMANVEGAEKNMLVASGLYFAIGIALALLSGLAAWFNFGSSMHYYFRASHPIMIISHRFLPTPDKIEGARRILVTYWISIILGLLSASMVLFGAKAAIDSL